GQPRTTQSHIEAGTVSRACRSFQPAVSAGTGRQPADYRMAVTQSQNLATELQRIHAVLGTDDEYALWVQARCPQPLMADRQRWIDEGQPAGTAGLTQVSQHRSQPLQALARRAVQADLAESGILRLAGRQYRTGQALGLQAGRHHHLMKQFRVGD